jgi:carboxymethylenebutenolidase
MTTVANIQTATISYRANGGNADGYLARPDDQAQHPGVIVIQEWWGINDNIKDISRRFAEAGYVALAPDLYHGKVVLNGEPNEAQKAMMALDQAEVAKNLHGAVQALKSRPEVSPKRVGVVGFCMGGRLALVVASQEGTDIGAVAGFYPGGYNPTEDDVKAIQCPVLAIYGDRDDSTPEAQREKFRKYLADNGKTFDMVVYPGAHHAFFNDTRPEVYDAAAAEDAWNRTLAWFSRYLR